MTFFGVRDFGKDFFGGLTKSETQVSRFYVKQLYHDAKPVWNSLELLLLYFFNWTFFGLLSGPLDFFWVRV